MSAKKAPALADGAVPASTNWLTRPIGRSAGAKPKASKASRETPPPAPPAAAATAATAPKAAKAAGRPGGSTPPPAPIIVGEPARVSLMPPEVLARRRGKAVRRSLLWAVLGVVLITFAAVGGTAVLGFRAQLELAGAQAETSDLLAQQSQYREVRKVQDQVTLVEAAQQVGASTEIDWKDYLQKVQSTLPADVTLMTVTIDSATPLATYAQPTAPLLGERVATLSFEASSPTLPVVPTWLNALATLPGFADATPGSVTLDQTSGAYTVDITMHINESAFDRRFETRGK